MMNDNYTKIPNSLVKGDDEMMTSKELSIITTLLINKNCKDICLFSLRLLYDLFNITNKNTYSQKEIKNILKMFSDEDVLSYYDNMFLVGDKIDISNINKNDLVYAKINIAMDDSFTMVKDIDIFNLIEYSNKNKIDTYSLLQTYIYICSCINCNENDENYQLCFPSILNISDMIDISENTVLKYIEIFKNLNVFVCDYAGYRVLSDGKIKNGNMFYTRPENEELLLNRLNKERQEKGFIKISNRLKDKTNLKRAIKQKINNLNNKEKLNKIEQEQIIKLNETYNSL